MNPDYIEYLAVAFNIAYVILAARQNIWCWPMGIVGSVLSILLFVESKLYAESVLFSYYVVMGFYGWYQWKGKRDENRRRGVAEWKWTQHFFALAGGYIATYLLILLLRNFTDAAMPLLDSFTTVFSFIATWMVARRVLENWIYWIAIDALTVYLYASRNFDVYAILSLAYTFMAMYGYWIWKKDLDEEISRI